MTCLTNRRGVVHLMAVVAAIHRGNAGDFRHAIHLRNLAMTHLAFHARIEMLAMAPLHPYKQDVDAHPRNWFAGFCKRRELLNGRLVLGNRHVALHASASCRESHQTARSGIRMAGCACEPQRQMCLVTVGNRLNGRRMYRRVVRHFLLYCLRRRWLLRRHAVGDQEDEYRNQRGNRQFSSSSLSLHQDAPVSRRSTQFAIARSLTDCLFRLSSPLPQCWFQNPGASPWRRFVRALP